MSAPVDQVLRHRQLLCGEGLVQRRAAIDITLFERAALFKQVRDDGRLPGLHRAEQGQLRTIAQHTRCEDSGKTQAVIPARLLALLQDGGNCVELASLNERDELLAQHGGCVHERGAMV